MTPASVAPQAERDAGSSRRGLARRTTVVRIVVAAVAIALVGVVVVAAALSGSGLGVGDAVVLGLVEGVTEWLPISSTGHLTVVQDLLGIDGDAATSYAIAIQAGAILAVLGLYRARFRTMLLGVAGRDPEGRRLVGRIVVACLPAVAVGLAFEDVIKDRLFGPWPVVVAWFMGGVAILTVAGDRLRGARGGAHLSALSWRGAAVIGVAQTVAMWPGVSRSLMTILAGTLVGLAIPAAVEFSFLLGFVILGGATAYEMASSGSEMVEAYGLAVPLLGLAVAFVSAALAMRWMVAYLNRRGLGVFGWYRIGVAVVVAGLLLTGVVDGG